MVAAPTMDPLSITGLSLTILQILGQVTPVIWTFIENAGSANQTLDELRADLNTLYELIDSINRLFQIPSFVEAMRQVQADSQVNLVECLHRALQNCSRELQRLADILYDFKSPVKGNRIKQSILQFRLDRHMADIVRIKQNFQDHKSSIQLAFQVVTTCKQMQTAERDEVHASELKAKIDDLQEAIQLMSKLINQRQTTSDDSESTKVLIDMKDIQATSLKIKRQATIQLDRLTSLIEDTKVEAASTPKAPPRPPPKRRHLKSGIKGLEAALEEEQDSGESPRPKSSSTASTPKKPSSPIPIRLKSPETPNIAARSPPSMMTHSPDASLTTTTSISLHDFEEDMVSLLASAANESMGIEKAFSDDTILRIGELLASVGKQSWSQRPRTYLVLRLINEIRAMDSFVFEGFKDIDFPYTETTLPKCIRSTGSRHDFLQKQRYVLNARSADLVQGGRHHHLDKSADTYFTIVEKLGSGGFSVVDRVRSKLTLQDYARKRIDRSSTFAKDRKALRFFENEIHHLKRLSHHHLVRFVGSYTDKRYIGIIMEPVADTDLRSYLARDDWTFEELGTLRSFLGCLSSALKYLHMNKCRHKDLKPHNILIKGDTILLADFGIALDWTDSQRETTMGRPEAYTELYVAPEVGLQKPRNTAADVWSLGCIFLEIATIICGHTLESRAESFQLFGNGNVVYWRNPEAIGHWLSVLESSSPVDKPMFGWIESMTAVEAASRLKAEALVAKITQAHTKTVRYTRACCNEDLGSDDTSWEGSASEDDLFETSKDTTEDTTISSGNTEITATEKFRTALADIPKSAVTTEQTGDIQKEARPSSPPRASAKSRFTWHELKQPPNAISRERLKNENAVEISAQSLPRTRPSANHTTSTMSDETVVAAKENPVPRRQLTASTSSQKELESHQAINMRFVHISREQSKDYDDTETATEVAVHLVTAFNQNHKHLEELLAQLRQRQDPSWKDLLTTSITPDTYDSKGFNLLLLANTFKDDALARDILELAIQHDRDTVNHRNIFGNSALHYAAAKDRSSLIKYLVKSGARLEVINVRGQTPLHVAVREQCFHAVRLLLRYATVDYLNVRDDTGKTALHLACRIGTPTEIVNDLLSAGAEVDIRDNNGDTAAEISERIPNFGVMEILHPEGIDDVMAYGPPPSRSSIGLGSDVGMKLEDCQCEVCRLVVSAMSIQVIDPSVLEICPCAYHLGVLQQDTLSDRILVDFTFKTCMCPGCVSGRDLNTKYIGHGPPASCSYASCTTNDLEEPQTPQLVFIPPGEPPAQLYPEDFAMYPLPAYPGDEYYDGLIEEVLLDSTTDFTPQQLSAEALDALNSSGFKGKNSYRNNPEKALVWVMSNYEKLYRVDKIVGILLDCGARVNTQDKSGCTCLHIAAKYTDIPLAQLLLDRGAFVDLPRRATFAAKADYTPLRYALFFNSTLLLRLLLRAGANINDQSVYTKTTLLHEACYSYAEVGWHIPLLLAHGASTSLIDDEGNTALHIAIQRNRIHAVTALLDAGADIEAIGKAGLKPLAMALQLEADNYEMIELLLSRGADAHARCNTTPCALFYAVQKGYGDIVDLLLEEYDAADDIHLTDLSGRTALHILASSSISGILNIIDPLMEYGANIDAEDYAGNTPLHDAAKLGSSVMVSELLAKGATMHPQNRAGKTPLDLAMSKKHREVVEYLGGSLKKKGWFRRS